MNITYILGNGFDIQLGLSTRYSDFLKEYVAFSERDDANIRDFKRYLQKTTRQELWSDAEKAMGIYIGEFSESDLDKYLSRISDFQVNLFDYLEAQQNKCSWKKPDLIAEAFTDFLLGSFQDVLCMRGKDLDIVRNRENNTFQFITFNYTNLLDKILECCSIIGRNTLRFRSNQRTTYSDNIGDVFYVHGKISSTSLIIMGVNDESQLKCNPLITLSMPLKEQLIKPYMNSALGHNWDAPAMRAIHNSDIIAIYGVSYGETDNLWWSDIRQWLEADSRHKLVAFIWEPDTKTNFKIAGKSIVFERSKRKEILHKLGYQEEDPQFEELLTQIYIIFNTARLNFSSLILKNSEAELAKL